jgi:hypothetical protein
MNFHDQDHSENLHSSFYQSLSQAITDLRERLRTRYERIFPGQKTLIENVLEEAESAAWCTPFPHLFLPDFAEARIARIATSA